MALVPVAEVRDAAKESSAQDPRCEQRRAGCGPCCRRRACEGEAGRGEERRGEEMIPGEALLHRLTHTHCPLPCPLLSQWGSRVDGGVAAAVVGARELRARHGRRAILRVRDVCRQVEGVDREGSLGSAPRFAGGIPLGPRAALSLHYYHSQQNHVGSPISWLRNCEQPRRPPVSTRPETPEVVQLQPEGSEAMRSGSVTAAGAGA